MGPSPKLLIYTNTLQGTPKTAGTNMRATDLEQHHTYLDHWYSTKSIRPIRDSSRPSPITQTGE